MATCPYCNSAITGTSGSCAACGSPLVPEATAEAVLALPSGTPLQSGTFVINALLRQGGFGITYLGTDHHLGRKVAIKELFLPGSARRDRTVLPRSSSGPSSHFVAKEKFLEEARMVARFQHPVIIKVFQSFEENNTAYFVMEYIKGQPLDNLLMAHGALPEGQAIQILDEVGAALEIVHADNVLHRDINPRNIMLAEDGRVILIDFGTAREFTLGQTVGMTAFLSHGYAPLEQYSSRDKPVASRHFGPPTDIYALGATMYHMLTGDLPFEATARADGVDLKPPHKVVPGISIPVGEAVMWAMEIKAADRPRTVSEFLRAVRGQAVPRQSSFAGAKAASSFKFRKGEAFTLPELIKICDRFSDEGQEYLFNGYLERWLVESLGDAVLAQEARRIGRSHGKQPRQGLELMCREMCKRAALPLSRLDPQPAMVDFGTLPQGGRASFPIQIRVAGRGIAWGSIGAEPADAAVSAPTTFDTGQGRLDLRLDTLKSSAGAHKIDLVLRAEGLPDACRVPVRFTVTPIKVSVMPERLDLGSVSYGGHAAAAFKVCVSPSGGRIQSQVSLVPPQEGVNLSSPEGGGEGDVDVSVDAGAMEAGRTYRTRVRLDTTAGQIEVPLSFRTTLRWGTVMAWAAACAVACGAALGAIRSVLAGGSPRLGEWLFSMDGARADKDLLVACGVFGGLVVGTLVGAGYLFRASVKKGPDA